MSEQVSPRDRRLTDPKHVFGMAIGDNGMPVEGFARDKLGRPVEQGIGSPGHETPQHYNSIIQHSKDPKAVEAAQKSLDTMLAKRLEPKKEEF